MVVRLLFLTQLGTERPLHLANDLAVGQRLARLVLVDNRRLLIDGLRQLRLGPLLVHARFLDALGERHAHRRVREDVRLGVELGQVLVARARVGAGAIYNR